MLLVPLSPNREISIIAEALAVMAPGKIAGASLTNSYATLLTMGGAARAVFLLNSTDQAVSFSLNGGTTEFIELDSGECTAVDLYSLGLYATSGTISAKWVTLQPSTGSARAAILRV